MAKLLAYKTATRRVVTVNTVTPAVTNLGSNDISLANTTNAFPNVKTASIERRLQDECFRRCAGQPGA